MNEWINYWRNASLIIKSAASTVSSPAPIETTIHYPEG